MIQPRVRLDGGYLADAVDSLGGDSVLRRVILTLNCALERKILPGCLWKHERGTPASILCGFGIFALLDVDGRSLGVCRLGRAPHATLNLLQLL